MTEKFYFDTSIWLDFLENRDEPNFSKGMWAKKLIKKIIKEGNRILFSDNNFLELINNGYLEFEIEEFLSTLKPIIIPIEATEKEIGKSKDLCQKCSPIFAFLSILKFQQIKYRNFLITKERFTKTRCSPRFNCKR